VSVWCVRERRRGSTGGREGKNVQEEDMLRGEGFVVALGLEGL